MEERKNFNILDDDFENLKKKNKEKNDPNNIFPDYDGDRYRWGIKSQDDQVIISDEIDNGDYFLVSYIGDFCAGVHMEGPSYTNPMGNYGAFISKGIFVTTKIKNNGEVENHLLFSNYDRELFKKNMDLVKNELFSDENIKFAEENNNGYLGNVVKFDDDEKARIVYNDIYVTELVNSLAFAKKQIIKQNGHSKNNYEIYQNETFDYHTELAQILKSGRDMAKEIKTSITENKLDKDM